MDAEKRARRQSLRVLISEAVMVIAVIVTVSVLAFVVSGYWVGSDFKIERQGLVQIYSSPTGADIEIDGNSASWLQRTNTSKTLSAGEHTIKLTKEGYDSWSRTINITEGLLYRLHYPRLFLENRTNESAFSFSGNFATISPNRNNMLLAGNTTAWQTFNLDSDSAKPQKLDLSKILPFISLASDATEGLFGGTIIQANWATDNEHLLLKVQQGEISNFLVINVLNPTSSVNLTKEFNVDFSKIEILNDSASELLAVIDGNLHRIDVSAKQISGVLVKDIVSFDYYDQNLIFAARTPEDADAVFKESNSLTNEEKTAPYYIGLLRLGSTDVSYLRPLSSQAAIMMTKFYDDEYVGVLEGAQFSLFLKKDFEEKAKFELSFSPEAIKIGQNGEFITMYTSGRIATLDMEAMVLNEWETGTDTFGWLDGSMIYAVKDGILNVYDFNGLNHRTLATNVSSHFPVTITADKYLYYFRDGSLIREYLYEK